MPTRGDNPVPPPVHPELRFHNYASFLRRRIGGTAARIGVDGGFTCPNRDGRRGTGGCRYCNNDSFAGGIRFPGLPVEEQVRRAILATGRGSGRRVLVYFQRYSSSYAPPELLDRTYRAAFRHPGVVGIVVGTRPDCLGPAVLDVLEGIAREHYVSVEVGLQSISDEVLANVGRGHTVAEFTEAVNGLRRRGLDTGVHLIYGLPGDTRENYLAAAEFLSGLDVQGVKLHHFHVVSGSGFEGEWRAGRLRVPEYGEYLSACVDFLERLSPDVAVLRLMAAAPPGILLAPVWEKPGREMGREVSAELRRRGAWQGCRRDGGDG